MPTSHKYGIVAFCTVSAGVVALVVAASFGPGHVGGPAGLVAVCLLGYAAYTGIMAVNSWVGEED